MGFKIYRKTVLTMMMVLMFSMSAMLGGCGKAGEGTNINSSKESIDLTQSATSIKEILEKTAKKQMEVVERPTCAAIGGEWTIIGVKNSGVEMEESYPEIYLANLKKTLKETEGILSESKYTEYSRVILALTVLGENPDDFAGYNLLAPLSDFDKTVKQGVNGAAYALIALDSGGYELPETDAENPGSREKYIEWILEKEREEGGFSLSDTANGPEADLTAMVLQSLVPYQEEEEVKDLIERGIEVLSSSINEGGYYESFGEISCESTAQAIIALSAVGIDCNTDERFVKNGKGLVDILLTFYDGEGGFAHRLGGETDIMATEQALCALAAYEEWMK